MSEERVDGVSRSRRLVDGLRAGAAASLPVGALVLVSAGLEGTWIWPRGLAFAGGHAAISMAGAVALALFKPATLRVRRQGVVAPPERRQPLIDAVGTVALMVYWLAWLIFIPVDVFQFRLLPPPPRLVADLGGALALFGLLLNQLAVWQNPFSAPNVQDQSAGGQRVIDHGVYGLIRHPIYAGNLLLFSGAALWLGSTAAFVGVSVLLVATIGRILVEEAYLRANLSGYEAYARRVRGRLIPGLL
ncbi:isoprenylcysteine carboxylmethyltransferase family protein [soil metagenome]